jgi:putative transposase
VNTANGPESAGPRLDADAPNRIWVTGFTYRRSWAGSCYVAFIVDVFAQRIVAWHAATTKASDLMMTPCGCRCGNAAGRIARPEPGR